MRTTIIFSISCFVSAILVSCGPKERPLAAYFPVLPLPDTLQFALTDNDEPAQADTVPNTLFFNALPPEMYAHIEHVADSAGAAIFGRGRFRLDERYEAWWAEVRYFWFQHQSLLLYDVVEKRFTDRITVAEWYGGEGGQILTGSWLLQRDGGKALELVQRQDEYSIRFMDEEVLQDTARYISFWQRRGGRFSEIEVRDSLGLIRDFPLEK